MKKIIGTPRPRKCGRCSKEDCGEGNCNRCGYAGHETVRRKPEGVGRFYPSNPGGKRPDKYLPDEENTFGD